MTPRYPDAPSPSPSRRYTEGSCGQIRRDAMCRGSATSSSPVRRSSRHKKINQWRKSSLCGAATRSCAEATDVTEAAARRPTGASDAIERAAHASRSLPGWTCPGLVDNARRRVRRAETRPPSPSRGMASPEAAAILRELQQQRDNGVRRRFPPPRVSIALFSGHERYSGRSRAIEAPLIGHAPPGARAGIPDRSKRGGPRPLLRDSFFFSAAASREHPAGSIAFSPVALSARASA